MVVSTELTTVSGGCLRLTDLLALRFGERGHEIGHSSPHVLVRFAEALAGEIDVDVDLVPRLTGALGSTHLDA